MDAAIYSLEHPFVLKHRLFSLNGGPFHFTCQAGLNGFAPDRSLIVSLARNNADIYSLGLDFRLRAQWRLGLCQAVMT